MKFPVARKQNPEKKVTSSSYESTSEEKCHLSGHEQVIAGEVKHPINEL